VGTSASVVRTEPLSQILCKAGVVGRRIVVSLEHVDDAFVVGHAGCRSKGPASIDAARSSAQSSREGIEVKKLRQVRDARIELANMREGWLANRSSLLAGAHRRASGAMAGNLREI